MKRKEMKSADVRASERPHNVLQVWGAREHNLRNVNVSIPKNSLTIITGPSGSGKSSLALDVLHSEGKRRYVESLSLYARQFLKMEKKADVDRIDGLIPSIAIEQKTIGHNPRSTVATVAEVYDFLRVLYARIGTIHCPTCRVAVAISSPSSVGDAVIAEWSGQVVAIYAPFTLTSNQSKSKLRELFGQGFYQCTIDGAYHRFATVSDIDALTDKHHTSRTVNVIIDSFTVDASKKARLYEAVERAFALADQRCTIVNQNDERHYCAKNICAGCSWPIPALAPLFFSFNTEWGACTSCHGLGIAYCPSSDADDDHAFSFRYAKNQQRCPSCHGKRLKPEALAVTIAGNNIMDLCALTVTSLRTLLQNMTLTAQQEEIARPLIKELVARLTFLAEVGLHYLTLDRSIRTLSGGEAQRIRLATQIGSALSGVLYVLDEPSIGLHQRDNQLLINTFRALKDLGNTVVVVEHDLETISHADYVVDMGPAAGSGGGMVTAVGTPEQLKDNPASLTGAYLAKRRQIHVPATRRKPSGFIDVKNASSNNLKNIAVRIPLGVICGISGVSGSGKSSLVMNELVPAVERLLGRKFALDHLVIIDQDPIGRSSRSNPATYMGIFNDIRTLFAKLPESNARGYTAGQFSFNMPEGRCAECKGDGSVTVEMHFLPPVILECKSCHGKRYHNATLEIKYRGKTIADVLSMTIGEATLFFAAHPPMAKRLQLLCDVGLGYLCLGQSATTLSGGEAQRIKLAFELAKRGSRTMYILDEPTTGLHLNDIEKLLHVLGTLVDKGNSMIIIEHNLDLLKTVDYLIDMGPEGGSAGGEVVAVGTPEQVAASPRSITGAYLAPLVP